MTRREGIVAVLFLAWAGQLVGQQNRVDTVTPMAPQSPQRPARGSQGQPSLRDRFPLGERAVPAGRRSSSSASCPRFGPTGLPGVT